MLKSRDPHLAGGEKSLNCLHVHFCFPNGCLEIWTIPIWMKLGQIVLRKTNTFVSLFWWLYIVHVRIQRYPTGWHSSHQSHFGRDRWEELRIALERVIQLSLKGGKMGLSEHI